MSERVGSCTIRSRLSPADPEHLGWLYVADRRPTHDASRGCLGFRNADEVQAAIRELRKLLPAVDQLAEIADG